MSAPAERTGSDCQTWRMEWLVQFVPPGYTAELADGHKITGPANHRRRTAMGACRWIKDTTAHDR